MKFLVGDKVKGKKYINFPLKWYGSSLHSIEKVKGNIWRVTYIKKGKFIIQRWKKGQMISSNVYSGKE